LPVITAVVPMQATVAGERFADAARRRAAACSAAPCSRANMNVQPTVLPYSLEEQ
jgi:hypothetical protein